MPTIPERIADAQQRSVACYMRRQGLEQTRQQVALSLQQCDLELVRLDGELRLLSALAEADRGQ